MFALRYIVCLIGFLLVNVNAAPQSVARALSNDVQANTGRGGSVAPKFKTPSNFINDPGAGPITLSNMKVSRKHSLPPYETLYILEGQGRYDPQGAGVAVPEGGFSPGDLKIRVWRVDTMKITTLQDQVVSSGKKIEELKHANKLVKYGVLQNPPEIGLKDDEPLAAIVYLTDEAASRLANARKISQSASTGSSDEELPELANKKQPNSNKAKKVLGIEP